MLIDDDVWVTVRYRLFDAQGEAIESGERELTYLQGGYGAVFPRIEEALEGHGPGYETTVYLEPEDSFGDYEPELVRLASREHFPEELEVGMTFEGVPGEEDDDDEGDGLYTVTDFTEDEVVLDANHPLAGMSLKFELRVLDVREASPEEIAQERQSASAYADHPRDDDWDDASGDVDDEPGEDDAGRGEGAREVRRLH